MSGKEPVKVCITGAAGQIGYSLMYMVAKGEVFGYDQPIILSLLDITPMMGVLEGVKMELTDCAFELLHQVIASDDPEVAFNGISAALLVGAFPRKEGMERKDLLKANVKIFEAHGKALDKVAKKDVKVVVVGNPANTNALICSTYAPSIPKRQFSALTRLDLNRAKAQLAAKVGVPASSVSNVIIWGNHSATQFPDAKHAVINGKPAYSVIQDDAWLKDEFVTIIQQRGANVIKARKMSSAMSAAKAICDHMRNWWSGVPAGQFVSMAVISDGNTYEIPEGLIYSVPVEISSDGVWKAVAGLAIDDFARNKMDISAKELLEERSTALEFIKSS